MTPEAGKEAGTQGRRGGRRNQLSEAGASAPVAVGPPSRPEPESAEGAAPHYHGHRERSPPHERVDTQPAADEKTENILP
jgi:hypothetical protein